MASLSVRAPEVTALTLAPSSFMRNTLGFWRSMSTAPMKISHGRPKRAHTVATATPCWPAPVSAMMRVLPMRRASWIWPRQLLILCAAGVIELVALEVDLGAAQVLGEALGEVERARPAGVVGVEIGQLLLEGGVGFRLVVGALQVEDQRHQRLGDEAAAEHAEEAKIVRPSPKRIELRLFGLASSSLPFDQCTFRSVIPASCRRYARHEGGDPRNSPITRG